MPTLTRFHAYYNRFLNTITRISRRPLASILAFFLIILWAFTVPFFVFSNIWQLFINSSTTIITFLMVFIILQSQNKDTIALQLKLNKLIASQKNASTRLINIEDLTSNELNVLKKFYTNISGLSAQDNDLYSFHFIEEATTLHKNKRLNTNV